MAETPQDPHRARAVKVLRYLKQRATIELEGGWYMLKDSRHLSQDGLQLIFRHVIDHHQSGDSGRIREVGFEVQRADDYIRPFSNPPEHWQREGGKLAIGVGGAARWPLVEHLCDPDEYLLIQHRGVVGLIRDKASKTLKTVNDCLSYDGG